MFTDDAPGRYVERETDDGALLIEDSENENAWIRCDDPIMLSWTF